MTGEHLIPYRSALPPPPQSIGNLQQRTGKFVSSELKYCIPVLGSNGELVRAAPSEIATRSATMVEPLPVRMGSSEGEHSIRFSLLDLLLFHTELYLRVILSMVLLISDCVEGNSFMLGGATPMNVSMVVPLPG